jgi:hypothetical protein
MKQQRSHYRAEERAKISLEAISCQLRSSKKRNAPNERQKRGCCGSSQLAIVVPTRSWREISWWKTQQTKNSLNFPSTCLKVVDTRRAGNVLRAEREPWLVIDPKPFLGDPAYDATQHLFNCCTRLRSDPDKTVRSFADLLGVEHERVRLWTFARAAAEPRDDWKNGDLMTIARAIARD